MARSTVSHSNRAHIMHVSTDNDGFTQTTDGNVTTGEYAVQALPPNQANNEGNLITVLTGGTFLNSLGSI